MHKTILPLCLRRQIIDLVLFYKYLHNYVDCDFYSYFKLVGSLHSLRSSNKGPLHKLPRVKTTALQVSYYHGAIVSVIFTPTQIVAVNTCFDCSPGREVIYWFLTTYTLWKFEGTHLRTLRMPAGVPDPLFFEHVHNELFKVNYIYMPWILKHWYMLGLQCYKSHTFPVAVARQSFELNNSVL